MKSIVLTILLALSLTTNAQKLNNSEKIIQMSEYVGFKDQKVNTYLSGGDISRIEIISPYMDKRASVRTYNKLVDKFSKDSRFTRLNGGKFQVLFMEGNNINNCYLICRLHSEFGYRVAVSYNKSNNEED